MLLQLARKHAKRAGCCRLGPAVGISVSASFDDLLSWMILVLCIMDLCFYAPDIVYVLDGSAPPLMHLLIEGIDVQSSGTLYYDFVRVVSRSASPPP